MSASLLYHAFGTRGYCYVHTAYTEGPVIFIIRQESQTCRFSACGSGDVVSRGRRVAVPFPVPNLRRASWMIACVGV